MDSKKNKFELSDHSETIDVGVVMLLILSGVGVFLWQVYQFLRFDQWVSVSLIDALRWLDLKWAHLPTEWIGLYRVLDFIPLSISLVVLSVCYVFWVQNLKD